MYNHHHQSYLNSLHEPIPRRRQPSSTSSTLLTPSEGSDVWMPNSATVKGSSITSTSLFSDEEQETDTNKGDELTEVGTVDMPKIRDEQDDRPLIDFEDNLPRTIPRVEDVDGKVPMPTPGDKLRMLLRQMEAEVRNTSSAPPPPLHVPSHTRRPSSSSHGHANQREAMSENEAGTGYTPVPGPSRSHWREGRRIGALPKERSYSPISSPERRTRTVDNQEEEEELEDSPPSPPLRITNPYLYNSRKVSDERRSQSPRISSRAAVLHASTSRSPPTLEPETESRRPTALESYLARAPAAPVPVSPTRKGKEREMTPTPPRQPPSRMKGRSKTPRKWSVELAPDDSVLFAEGIPAIDPGEVELDLDESAEPPWAGIGTDTDGEESEEEVGGASSGISGRTALPRNSAYHSHSRSRSMKEGSPDMVLPALPEIQASYDDSEEGEIEEIPIPTARPSSRSRSRFSQSLSSSTSLRQPQHRSPQHLSPSTSHSRSATQNQSPSVSFTTAKSTSPSFRLNRQKQVPPVQPIFSQEPIQVGMAFTPFISTPPRRSDISTPVPGQTPKPPGAWLSASKPQGNGNVRFKQSSSPLRQQEDSITSGDTSFHRIKLSPARPNRQAVEEEEGDISITQKIMSISKSLSLSLRPTRTIPKPSTTLTEARLALERAAEASAIAQMKVESTQRQWLEAIGGMSMSGEKAVEVIRQSWSWGRWAWWISMEILLLWGVFRVTLEYTQMAQYRPFDPSHPASGSSLALSVPLPTAISAFIIPGNRRGSVNFFDLLEGLEVWKILGGGDVDGLGKRWVQVPT